MASRGGGDSRSRLLPYGDSRTLRTAYIGHAARAEGIPTRGPRADPGARTPKETSSMAGSGAKEARDGQRALAAAAGLAAAVPSQAYPEPEGDPGRASGQDGHPDRGPDPGPQGAPQPQDPNPGAAGLGEDVLGLPFPRKLWMMVEDSSLASVQWNDAGDAVVIDEGFFQTEVLQRSGPDRIFETDSLKTFIRQLHLHGFSKIRSLRDKGLMIYSNSRFLRGRPELLDSFESAGPAGRMAHRGLRAAPKRRKISQVATRRSPRLLQLNANKEAWKKTQEAPAAQGPGGAPSTLFSGAWPTSGVAGSPGGGGCPGEPGGPRGEGTSGNVLFASRVPAGQEGAGELPSSPPARASYASVLTLYNTCCSILLAALSAMAPDEDPDGEDEQEGPSDYKCTLCEQFKDNPHP
ncbi:LOW QUALITY PROTEIN: heat shock transcription factor, X-linked member 3 [Talpa occidentalis]|uniref:LOW QUALITY PROTEIN: heat shock transcription factor, X-linked member 3 n=1 Tax=Talpa occidentalis TaxID=50954 RepID=UPI0023F8891A|nr:LOW QUALITY PROTEIN: heat shock transcription factor, X-linked member 3 [Talpa occidentalis]